MEGRTAKFRYYGLSIAEVEIIRNTLDRSFEVDDEQVEADDPRYVTMVEIEFPVQYDESFFQEFTMRNWYKIKEVIKDMKRRRGSKGVKAYLKFAGYSKKSPLLVFPILTKGDREFEMGIEKIEYLVDIVPTQLGMVPSAAEEVWYSYDDVSLKWHPDVTKSDGVNYFFKNNEWKKK